MQKIIKVENLTVAFFSEFGLIKAVKDVDFSLNSKETLAIVGESGCGKSSTGLALLGLLPKKKSKILSGKIEFTKSNDEIVDLLKCSNSEMQKIRGNEISMIFQEPMTSLNPVFTVGKQIDEVILMHDLTLEKNAVKEKSISLLESVGIKNPKMVYGKYPHELSGGMRQRVMIAMAISCNPKLIIADEPTTALDVTVQEQILNLFVKIKNDFTSSMIFITHDLAVVSQIADKVAVMYAGRIVESGSVAEIFKNPLHPYTQSLLRCAKREIDQKTGKLFFIPGNVPNLLEESKICDFAERCQKKCNKCNSEMPNAKMQNGHFLLCHHDF